MISRQAVPARYSEQGEPAGRPPARCVAGGLFAGGASGVRRVARAVVVAALVALTTAAPAHAVDSGNRCIKYSDRYRTVEMTKFGVVFYKEVRDGDSFFRRHYGCIFSTERARAVRGQDPSSRRGVGVITLNGRFVQYSIEDLALPTEGARVYVYDAKDGEVEFQADANNPDITDQQNHNDVIVRSIVGNASGATAWITFDVDFGTPVREVHVRRTGDGGQRVMVDRGTEINETSLAKSRDELTIYWLNDGQARSAPLD